MPTRFSPYTVHPLPEIDWGLQIPKRGDQRQMETWQRLGTYARRAWRSTTPASRATTRSARPWTWWWRRPAASATRRSTRRSSPLPRRRNDLGVLLNEKLTTELRPTLFLAQLSNLLAGNISIVHKVTGSSRTFMGEEGCRRFGGRDGRGAHPLRPVDACAGRRRLQCRTSRHAARATSSAGYLHRGAWRPVWERAGLGGRRRRERIGRRLPRPGIARACRKARRSGLCPARPRSPPGNARRDDGFAGAIAELIDARPIPAGESHAGDFRRLRRAQGDHGRARSARSATRPRRSRLLDADRPPEGSAVSLRHRARRIGNPHGRGYPAFDAGSRNGIRRQAEAVLATAVGYHRYEGAALVNGRPTEQIRR